MIPKIERLIDMLIVPPGKKIKLRKDYDPGGTGGLVQKKEAQKLLAEGVQLLAGYQSKLYARNAQAGALESQKNA